MLSKTSAPVAMALASALSVSAKPLPDLIDQPVRSSKRWLNGDVMRGVNLGSQFIIEPWMAADEWSSMGCGDANDEWSCVQSLGQDAADAAFKTHWESWITQDDISKISSYGLNTVRIPVGFWINEDLVNDGEYFPRGGLDYLDKMVGWCADAGIYVIMDLHGAPGGQTTDQQFTGHSVDYPEWFNEDNYERTYQWHEWMTNRIHTNDAYRTVGMLEVVNEPAQSSSYPSEAADMIANFYPTVLSRIRDAESSAGVADSDRLHVQFMADAWGSGDPTSNLDDTTNTAYDDHRYLKWDTSIDATKDGYISAACSDDRGDVSIGEWSISVADDVQDNDEFSIQDGSDSQAEWYKLYWAAQVQSFESKSNGWVFWSWKCNYIGGYNDYRWCYEAAVDAGAIPEDASSAASISPCSNGTSSAAVAAARY